MEEFKTSGLVPDVIDEAPAAELKVQFGSKNLHSGDTKTPTVVKDTPVVTLEQDPAQYYTLLFHGTCSISSSNNVQVLGPFRQSSSGKDKDPDAPSREDPKIGEVQHWFVMNITGNNVGTGEEVTAYIGSGAPKGTGLHRYVFLLYKQTNGRIDTKEIQRIPNTTAEGRRCQKARDIAKRFGLELVAGNFFLAEFDDYVPTLHAQLGIGK